ncbi:hypothetical protein GCM10027418_28780 [Mariniluteicoccus endophyticus]
MRSLVWSELRSRPGLWAWTLVSLAVASSCITGLLVSMSTALDAAVGDAETTEGLNALGANIVAGSVLSGMAVVGTTTTLTFATRSRDHALWVVLGVPRRVVRGVLLAQLVVVGVLGWLLGLPGSPAVAHVALGQWASIGLAPASLSLRADWWPPLVGLGLVVLSALAGGWGAARRAARTPEMAALREADMPVARVGWFRALTALGTLSLIGLIAWLVASGEADGPDDRAAAVLSGNLLLIIALLLVGGWVLRGLLWAWTALVPSVDPAWFVAREACRARSARSITTVLPFAMTLSLVGVLMGAGNGGGGDVTLDEVLIVLGWVMLVGWVGGVAVIALAGRERERDTALLVVVGADRTAVARAAVYEGLVYALTAVLFGAATTLVAVLTTAAAAGVPAGRALAGTPWGLLAGVAGLTLITTCAAVAPPAARAYAAPVTETLRR